MREVGRFCLVARAFELTFGQFGGSEAGFRLVNTQPSRTEFHDATQTSFGLTSRQLTCKIIISGVAIPVSPTI